MGNYLNPSSDGFHESLNAQIYVDKTPLIGLLNPRIKTRQKHICLTRPRRFGKSLTVDMLCAYYSRGRDSAPLFDNLQIAREPTYRKHLNRYDVICMNMADEYKRAGGHVAAIKTHLTESIVKELLIAYPQAELSTPDSLAWALMDVYEFTDIPFVVLVDEWDFILRENHNDAREIDDYLSWLNTLLKDKSYIGLSYVTGIVPVKKIGTLGVLNMFDEYSMTDPGRYAPYTGFTEDEVLELCRRYSVDAASMKQWYAGYAFEECPPVYNPRSVVSALKTGKIANYWSEIDSYEALQRYIDLEIDGLRQDIVTLLSGSFVYVDVTRFANDMVTLDSKNAVLTLLVHLGYLALDLDAPGKFGMQAIRIPNQEIRDEFMTAIKDDCRYAESYGLLKGIPRRNASGVEQL